MVESMAEMMLKGGFGASLSSEDIEREIEGILQGVDRSLSASGDASPDGLEK